MQVGAWDPYNVTEDADLGIRFHQAGYRTTMMDSTTYEEANTQVGNWVRQRSRWIKGYIQLINQLDVLFVARVMAAFEDCKTRQLIGAYVQLPGDRSGQVRIDVVKRQFYFCQS